MAGQDVFVISTSSGTVDTATRQFIRRHVMRGKNRRKLVAKLKAGSWMSREHTQQNGGPEEASTLSLARPEHLLSDFNTLQYADVVQPHSLHLLLNYFTVLIHIFYPVDMCLMFDKRALIWIEYMTIDAAYLHSALWAAQSYFGVLQGRPENHSIMFHQHQTLTLLQERLNDIQLATSDGTIATVAILVMQNLLPGGHKVARKHMQGLYQLVMLRGGVRGLRKNTQLQIKVCRADLSVAQITECEPLFFSGRISWAPFLATAEDVQHLSEYHILSPNVDMRFVHIFADLHKFAKSINLAFSTPQKIQPELFQEVLISIHYRLMFFEPAEDDFIKALWLGLLVFSSTLFLQIQGLGVPYAQTATKLKIVLLALSWPEQQFDETRLWLHFVAAITAVDGDQLLPKLNKILDSAGLKTWSAVRESLKKVLWVDAIHDIRGRKVFDEVALRKLPE